MEAKTASALLFFFSMLDWLGVILVMVEPNSVVRFNELGRGRGCGVFKCSSEALPSFGLCDDVTFPVVCAQIFSVILITLLSAGLAIHAVQAVGQGDRIPLIVEQYAKSLHFVAAVFSLCLTLLLLLWYRGAHSCGGFSGRMSDHGRLTYGVYFTFFVALCEAACYHLDGIASTGSGVVNHMVLVSIIVCFYAALRAGAYLELR